MRGENCWLELPQNFFEDKDIKIILSKEDGDKYVIFWLKLLLSAVDNSEPGILKYKPDIPYTPDILSTITDTNISVVRSALQLFERLKMLEINSNDEILIGKRLTQKIYDQIGRASCRERV